LVLVLLEQGWIVVSVGRVLLVVLPGVLVMVDRAVLVVHGLPSVALRGVVRVVVRKVRRAQHCMLVEVDRLNVVLVVEAVVQLRVVAGVLTVVVDAVGQQVLQVFMVHVVVPVAVAVLLVGTHLWERVVGVVVVDVMVLHVVVRRHGHDVVGVVVNFRMDDSDRLSVDNGVARSIDDLSVFKLLLVTVVRFFVVHWLRRVLVVMGAPMDVNPVVVTLRHDLVSLLGPVVIERVLDPMRSGSRVELVALGVQAQMRDAFVVLVTVAFLLMVVGELLVNCGVGGVGVADPTCDLVGGMRLVLDVVLDGVLLLVLHSVLDAQVGNLLRAQLLLLRMC